jgi:hypothetical protein
VTIDDQGISTSAIWHSYAAPAFYAVAIQAMAKLVNKAKVNGVFLSSELQFGEATKGGWSHLHVALMPSSCNLNKTKTDDQCIAEKKEGHRLVREALGDYDMHAIESALTLLKSNALYRSEAVLGQAQWLHDVKVHCLRSKNKHNALWKAVAKAPAGFCHPKSSMIG